MDNKLSVSQQCALAARKTNNVLGYISKSAVSRMRGVSISPYCTLMR